MIPASTVPVNGKTVDPALLAQIENEILTQREGRPNMGDRRGEWAFRCVLPGHLDQHPSATWNPDTHVWYCHVCKKGGGAVELASLLGILVKEQTPARGRVVATFDYHDAEGRLIYQVQRVEPGKNGRKKDFPFRRPDGAGGWVDNLHGVETVLYHYPDLISAGPLSPVFIAEGERKVDLLKSWGLVATCSPGGAGKWNDRFSTDLAGRPVVVLPDNDKPGRDHAADVVRSLLPVASSVKLVELPGLAEKGDVLDWARAGGTVEQLRKLVEAANFITFTSLGVGADDDDDLPVDLASIPEPEGPIPFLVENVIPVGWPTNLYGDSGQGKSYLAMYLSLCVVTGRPFLGRKVKRGPVLYVDWELNEDLQRRRLGEVCRGMGLEEVPRGLYYKHVDSPLWKIRGDVQRWREKTGAALIIFDSVGRALGTDPLDHNAAIRFYEQAEKLGTSLCIDHQPKGGGGDVGYAGKSEFGSSYKRHYSPSSWQVEKTGDAPGRIGVVLRHKKSNFGPLSTDLAATLTFEDVGQGRKTVTVEESTTVAQMSGGEYGIRARIIAALREGKATADELLIAIPEASLGAIRNELTALRKSGLVVEDSKQGRAIVYALASSSPSPTPSEVKMMIDDEPTQADDPPPVCECCGRPFEPDPRSGPSICLGCYVTETIRAQIERENQ